MLVERDAEREVVGAALDSARRGRGRFVLLYGQAGIGRSSLLRRSIDDARESGMDVLEACGSDLERGYGFGIVRQLLETRIAGLGAAERRSLLSHAGSAAESALGTPSSQPPTAGAAFDHIEAVYRLVGRLSSRTPLLVAVDDLQWCDRPSLDFLCFLGHRARQLPVTIVAAWRRGEPGVKAGRLQALAGTPETCFLSLAPLSRDGVRAVLRRELGVDPSDEAVDAVHAQTVGQPFLVSELAVGMRLRSVPVGTGCRGAIETVTPESLRRSIAARLARHPEAVQRLARAVAVLGDASVAHAAALAGIDRAAALRATDVLARAGVFRDEASVGYRQPIVRSAVYDTLSWPERAELHEKAARLFCDAAGGPDMADMERVARHLVRCEPVGEPRFADILRRAARGAVEEGRLADARRYSARSLGEIDEAAPRAEALVRLAELDVRLDDPAAGAAHAAEALALASAPSTRAAASLVWAQTLPGGSDPVSAAELLEQEALALAHADRDLGLELRATAACLRACTGVVPAAVPDPTIALADLPGETVAERAMLAVFASQSALAGTGGAARVGELCVRALVGDATAGAVGRIPGAGYLACQAAVLADAGDVVEAVLAQGPPDHVPTATREDAAAGAAVRSQLALSRGELAGAEAAAREALVLLEGSAPTAFGRRIRADLLASLVLVAIERGCPDEAEPPLAQLADLGDVARPAVTCLALARSLARSEPAAAPIVEAEEEPVGIAPVGGCARAWAALAHHAAGDRPRAQELAAEHLRFARAWGAPSVLGRALVVRGVVGARADRLGFLEEAVAVLEGSRAQLELARASIELGAALRRVGRPRRAREQLMRGADLAHRCGADALVVRARAELVATGARPRRAVFSGVGSLTAAERRVAVLAAAGLTNREIASELTVSPKTVSGQLAAVYLKLDVHDRSALATAMGAVEQANAELERVP